MTNFHDPRDIVATYGTPRSTVPRKRAMYYLRAVARRHDMSITLLKSRKRDAHTSAARGEYYLLCYLDTLIPVTVGAKLLGRDHTTLIQTAHAYKARLTNHEPTRSILSTT